MLIKCQEVTVWRNHGTMYIHLHKFKKVPALLHSMSIIFIIEVKFYQVDVMYLTLDDEYHNYLNQKMFIFSQCQSSTEFVL
jgi:hypothetical protein